jgi:large subunit ribosomal protein L30
MGEGKMIKITWFKSQIGAELYQKRTLRALGLHRLNESVTRPDNESVRGMVTTVRHLVKVEEVGG